MKNTHNSEISGEALKMVSRIYDSEPIQEDSWMECARFRAENAKLREALRESWHTFTCPYDHCQRCCDNEQIIVDIREWIVGGCGAFHLTNRLTAAAAASATGIEVEG